MDFINLENSGWNFVKKRDLVVNLNRLSEDKTWTNSMYLTHRSLTVPTCIDAIEEQTGFEIKHIVGKAKTIQSGLVLLWGSKRLILIAPPFPVLEDSSYDSFCLTQLYELLNKGIIVGTILLRLGNYAVGVFSGEKLLVSKVGSRYVKNRHKAGGSSQRRFERSRERLKNELFEKVCQVAGNLFSAFDNRMGYILLGGDQYVLQQFCRSCKLISTKKSILLQRRLNVLRPGLSTLENIKNDVWSSNVLVIGR